MLIDEGVNVSLADTHRRANPHGHELAARDEPTNCLRVEGQLFSDLRHGS
jgi:hypothetical protein